MSEAIDNRFEQYLEAVCDEYKDWWKSHAFMDEIDDSTWFEFELNSKTQEKTEEKPRQPEEKPPEKIQPILDALHEYRNEKKILIVGSSGAGKSTLLARVFWQTAQQARQDKKAPIPVLVELKAYQTTGERSRIRGLILSSLESYDPMLDNDDLKMLITKKRLLLLIDGLNELPQASAKTDLKNFCRPIPLVATARHAEDGWYIDRKLELQPPSAKQVERFFQERLPNSDRAQLEALGNRVKDFGQTPLMIWMLYSIFGTNREIPETRGEAYRAFTSIYTERAKEGIDLTESRFILSKLAFEMMQSQNKDDRTDFRLEIAKVDAENILGSEATLKHLMNHHLLSWQGKTGNRKIRFCHQSLQEYYAAEYLLLEIQKYPELLDKMPGYEYAFFQREYLNDVEWTESVALMVGMIGKEKQAKQAVRVVRLALEVDWMLGARLAGEVKREWQEQTVELLKDLKVPKRFKFGFINFTYRVVMPQWLKFELWGKTRSDFAVPGLLQALEDEDIGIRMRAVEALGNLGSETALTELLQALEDEYYDVREKAAEALGKLGSEAAIPGLLEAIEHENSDVRNSAVDVLGKLSSEAAIPILLQSLEDEDFNVREGAAEALGNHRVEAVLPDLLRALEHKNSNVRKSAAEALGKLGSEVAIPSLLQSLEYDENSDVRWNAGLALGKLGSEEAIPGLLQALEDENSDVRWSAALALGYLGSKVTIPSLHQALIHENSDARWRMICTLGKLGEEDILLELHQGLAHENWGMREMVAEELGELGSEAAIPGLFQALEDRHYRVREMAVEGLGKLGSEVAISGLFRSLEDRAFSVREKAAEALGKLGVVAAIPGLLRCIEDEDYHVREKAVEALGKLDSEVAIPGLLQALKHESFDVRRRAAEVLGQLGAEVAIPTLLQAFEYESWVYSYVRRRAAEALGNYKNDQAAHILPNLLTLILTEWGEEALLALTAIQANCKFYNYDIFRSPPIPKPQTEHPPGQTTNIFNIDTLTANHSPLNLGGTIGGNQTSTQNPKPEP